jgi:predicted alpha/beta-hydrolase family hydrolase
LVEPSARYEELKIALNEPVHGLDHVSAVLGVPRWWPTGARVSVVLAHGAGRDMTDPVVENLHRELTERRYLSLRFNFPFAEAGKRGVDTLPVLRRTYKAAISALAQDPTAAPAHLFIGGKGLGGQIAAELAGARVRIDGVFFLGFPLHPKGKPDEAKPELLYRIIAPMLFLQGTRDVTCDLDSLRRALTRVGATTALQICQEADHHFKVLKRSGRSEEEIHAEILAGVDGWIRKVLEG